MVIARVIWCAFLLHPTMTYAQPARDNGIWISHREVLRLPMSGPAWISLKEAAEKPVAPPNLSDQNQNNDVQVLAKALVYARTGEEKYRRMVIDNCLAAIGTEKGGRTLALGRNLPCYVVAADLVNLDEESDIRFREWLRRVRREKLEGRTLITTHEDRPNNWGTHAGAARAAIAVYLDDQQELKRTATVFKGYLGDRKSYSSFTYRDLSWQANSDAPVGINPKNSARDGHSIDGAMPDDMRRGTSYQWPPTRTGYPWEALQGAVVQAEILYRAGYNAWEWEDRALLRAVEFLYRLHWQPEGDDQWTPWIINCRYNTQFPTRSPARFGKSMGWTDWTHAKPQPALETR